MIIIIIWVNNKLIKWTKIITFVCTMLLISRSILNFLINPLFVWVFCSLGFPRGVLICLTKPSSFGNILNVGTAQETVQWNAVLEHLTLWTKMQCGSTNKQSRMKLDIKKQEILRLEQQQHRDMCLWRHQTVNKTIKAYQEQSIVSPGPVNAVWITLLNYLQTLHSKQRKYKRFSISITNIIPHIESGYP